MIGGILFHRRIVAKANGQYLEDSGEITSYEIRIEATTKEEAAMQLQRLVPDLVRWADRVLRLAPAMSISPDRLSFDWTTPEPPASTATGATGSDSTASAKQSDGSS